MEHEEGQKRRKGPHIVSVPINSWVNRRIINGQGSEISKKIGGELGVKINARGSASCHVSITGTDKKRVEAADGIIRQLDQQAGLIAQEDKLKNGGEVRAKHYELMKVHVDPLINKAKKDLGLLSEPHKDAGTRLPADPREGMFDNENTKPPAAKRSLLEAMNLARHGTSKKGMPRLSDAFEPRNQSQAITYLACKDIQNSYVFAAGPFGGGKTYTPLRAAFECVSEGRVSQILVIRPPTTSGKNPGAMPGNPRQKMDPYVKGGIADNIFKITRQQMDVFERSHVLRAFTPDFERGETYDHAFILVDEPQNLTVKQAKLLMGRLGEGSIMVFAGDIGGQQNDLEGEMSGLVDVLIDTASATQFRKALEAGTAFIEFKAEDSKARNPILADVAWSQTNSPERHAKNTQTVRSERRDGRVLEAIEDSRKYAVEMLSEIAKKTFARYEEQAQATFPALFAENVVRLQHGPRRSVG